MSEQQDSAGGALAGSSGWRSVAGVAGFSGVQLALEVLFVKLSRYDLGGLSLGVVGLAMLGVALASLLSRVLSFRRPGSAGLRAAALLGPLALGAGYLFFTSPHRLAEQAETSERILTLGLASLLVLAVSSVPVYSVIAATPKRAGRLYAASLLGAAVGVACVFGSLEWLGDWTTFAVVLALAALCSAALPGSVRARSVPALLCLTSAVAAFSWLPAADHAAHPDSIAIRSNSLSRIDVKQVGRRFRFDTAGINAGTSTVWGPVREPHGPWLLSQLSAAPFASEPERVLILGSGAGKNVIQAIEAGAEEVVAVELNALIIEYMREHVEELEDPYRDGAVQTVVGEGRHVVEQLAASRPASFELVYVPMVSLFGSSGHAFTQTYLMTREAFGRYAELLVDGGVYATLFVGPPSTQAKVVLAAHEALRERGVSEPLSHLVVLERGGDAYRGQGQVFVVLASPTARIADRWEPGPLRGVTRVDVAPLVVEGQRLSRLTDDNPFLYNDEVETPVILGVFGWSASFVGGLSVACLAVLILLWGLGIFAAPLQQRAQRAGVLAAFVAMGVGYACVQTFVLQRVGFLVGHPIAATSLVLAVSLLATGLGSHLSPRTASVRGRVVAGGLAVAAIMAVTAVSASTMSAMAAVPGLRWGIAVLMSAGPFVPLGMFFPLTLSRTAESDPAAIPWGWTLNGVGAVLGAFAVVQGSMRGGFWAVGVAATVVYALLAVWHAAWWDARLPRWAHGLFAALLLGGLAAVTQQL